MIIKSENLVLRGLEISDIDHLMTLSSESLSHKSTTPFRYPYSRKDFEQYILKSNLYENNRVSLAICPTEPLVKKEYNKGIVGTIDLFNVNWIHGRAEIGIIIWPNDLIGKGIGSATLSLVREWGFCDLRLNRLYAKAFSTNTLSINAFEKAGFLKEGILKKHFFVEGKYVDGVMLGITTDESNK